MNPIPVLMCNFEGFCLGFTWSLYAGRQMEMEYVYAVITKKTEENVIYSFSFGRVFVWGLCGDFILDIRWK